MPEGRHQNFPRQDISISSSTSEETERSNEFHVVVQRRGAYGRFLTQENEVKSGTPIAMEAAFLLAGVAVVWQCCDGWKVACAMVMTWLGARFLSAYEQEAAPGLGFLCNVGLLIFFSLKRHVTGVKATQWLQEDNDERMKQHLVNTREEYEKSSRPNFFPVEKIEEIKVKVRDGTEISVRLTFPKKTNTTTTTTAGTNEKNEDVSSLPSSPRPSLAFYCHGGAFVANSPRTMDSLTCEASNTMNAVIAAPYYRLAPEHKFPTAHEDCLDALAAIMEIFRVRDEGSEKGITQHSHLSGICDMSKICLFGDSAGGNLAAHLCFCLSRPPTITKERSTKQTNSSPALQLPTGCSLKALLLFYPVVTPYSPTASHVRNSNGHLIGHGFITWWWNKYLKDPIVEAHHPTVNLLLDDDINFGNIPSTVVITGQFDPLCDEGEQLATKLSAKMKEACLGGTSEGAGEMNQGNERRVFAARRLEPHCVYFPSTSAWAFKAGKALLNDEKVPDEPL